MKLILCTICLFFAVSIDGQNTKSDIFEESKKPLETVLLNEITVSASPKSANILSDIDVKQNPVNSSQEILRKVPGLFIGQHAGGGKAEQIFLRGFDLDHGTDIHITVDGMPVNMVSHAHGQGYADLHFLIPETIGKLDFGKGSYYADKGNLCTAGYVGFRTKDKLENSALTMEAGQFNTFRTVGLFKLLEGENNKNAYIATEYLATNGPFESPQNFNRLNMMGKYAVILPNQDKIVVSASHFKSKWDASGQIPQRAVDTRLVSRFGAIDNTEGGQTQRTNLNFQFNKRMDNNSFVKTTAYFSQYAFELYSNFTFFLKDSVNGDQIRQKENRAIYGLESTYNTTISLGKNALDVQFGAGLRTDDIKNIELSHTLNRQTVLNSLKLGDATETNAFSYLNAEYSVGKWVINPALRLDYFTFVYNDALATVYQTQSVTKGILSPKLNFVYNLKQNLQYYLKLGKGFHSNDTRVVVAQQGQNILPAAYSADLGLIWKPMPRLFVHAALWSLYLEQEFVYVGDEGVIEPSGRTQRQGVDVGLRYQITDGTSRDNREGVFFNGDVNYTYSRSMDAEFGKNYIPLAPDLTATGGLSIQKGSWAGSYKCRFMKNRPANADNSIVAKGYFINDVNVNVQWKNANFGLVVENIFNTAWNETQFATESRLKKEAQSVEEIHFTPGTPFFLKGLVTIKF